MRRADSTEAIGIALVDKAHGAWFRTIAARFGRPRSTVRRWVRAVREPHAQWLDRRGVEAAVLVDREVLVRPAPRRTTLGHALNLLVGAAVRSGKASAAATQRRCPATGGKLPESAAAACVEFTFGPWPRTRTSLDLRKGQPGATW